MQANHKVITVAAYSLIVSHLIGFFLLIQKYSINICGVHCFLSLTVGIMGEKKVQLKM